MIPGIDVSHWQREIDWGEVKRSGVKFTFIKATEFPDKKTSLHVDELMQNNIDGASANGIHWSAYHFFRTHIDPVIQAKVFCETVGEFSSMPPVLDLEVAGTRGERLNYKVKLFLEEVEKQTGKKAIIYSSGGFWRSYMCYEKRTHSDWARDYPLWIAQYTNLWPTALYPWAGWDFWQHTDKGKIPGVITNVDMNWFNGSEADLINRFISPGAVSAYENQITEQSLEVTSTSGVEKSYTGAQYVADSRGDFQEPKRQYRHIHVRRENAAIKHKKVIMGNAELQREDEWIKNYFLQQN